MFTVHGWLSSCKRCVCFYVCVFVCVDAVIEWNYQLLSHPALTADQKLEAAIQCWLNYRGQCFSSLRANIFTPLPILPPWQPYLLASTAEGRIMEGYKWGEAHRESCWDLNPGKKKVWALPGGGSPLFYSYIWLQLGNAACRVWAQNM